MLPFVCPGVWMTRTGSSIGRYWPSSRTWSISTGPPVQTLHERVADAGDNPVLIRVGSGLLPADDPGLQRVRGDLCLRRFD